MEYTTIDKDTAEETTITTVRRTRDELLSFRSAAEGQIVYWQERLAKYNAILGELAKEKP